MYTVTCSIVRNRVRSGHSRSSVAWIKHFMVMNTMCFRVLKEYEHLYLYIRLEHYFGYHN